MKKTERANTIAVKAINIMCDEDEALRLMWRGIEDSKKKLIKDKIAFQAAIELEEYAGSIPIEPDHKVILILPNFLSDRTLFLKDRKTGTLKPVQLVAREQPEEDDGG